MHIHKSIFLYVLQVVIIDEAHNLSDTLSCIHSAELNGAQVDTLIYRSRWICRSKCYTFPDVFHRATT